MRIATWNLQRGGSQRVREAQERTLREVAADVAILTEPPSSYQRGRAVVTSPPERAGKKGAEAWVAIVGDSVEPVDLVVPFARMAVAARAVVGAHAAIIYGAVLPWLSIRSHAPELVLEGETSFDAFKRVLAEQARDIEELRQVYGQRVIWAGDFNETVEGAVGGSWKRRALLSETLATLGLDAWNGSAAHASAGLCAIDLICGPREEKPQRQGRIDPVCEGVEMSDHAGYWVDV